MWCSSSLRCLRFSRALAESSVTSSASKSDESPPDETDCSQKVDQYCACRPGEVQRTRSRLTPFGFFAVAVVQSSPSIVAIASPAPSFECLRRSAEPWPLVEMRSEAPAGSQLGARRRQAGKRTEDDRHRQVHRVHE